MKEAEGLAEVRAFIERMKQLNGDEVRGVQFPLGVDAYMRERVLAGDFETVSFMHRLACRWGKQLHRCKNNKAAAKSVSRRNYLFTPT